jgi:hypothetical protein
MRSHTVANGSIKEEWLGAEQGFVDQSGVFVSREEAQLIAQESCQIRRRVGGDTHRLFSENLY